jgi:predicted HicB family RNase H-like nuclease
MIKDCESHREVKKTSTNVVEIGEHKLMYKKYKANYFYDDLIQSLSGSVYNLKGDVIGFEGKDLEELKQSFILAVEGYLEDFKK